MSVFKRLKGGDHSIEPFEVNASQSIVWTSGSGTTTTGFSINLALKPSDGYPDASGNLGGSTDGGFYSYPLYKSIEKFFYINSSSFSDIYGFYPESDVFVFNIPSGYFGNSIKPLSFQIGIDSTTDTINDDGTSKLRLNGTGSVIGNVFYNHGICVLKKDDSAVTSSLSVNGIGIVSESVVSTTFRSSVTIYEHTVVCSMTPFDFNTTVNPSVFTTASDGVTYCDRLASGSYEIRPYVTTIGLFNDYNELLAIAKVSNPIVRQRYTDQTFIIKFDE